MRPLRAEPIAERAEDRRRQEVADEEHRREEPALEVREVELLLHLRQDRRDDEAIEVVEEVEPREQREDRPRSANHRRERTTDRAAARIAATVERATCRIDSGRSSATYSSMRGCLGGARARREDRGSAASCTSRPRLNIAHGSPYDARAHDDRLEVVDLVGERDRLRLPRLRARSARGRGACAPPTRATCPLRSRDERDRRRRAPNLVASSSCAMPQSSITSWSAPARRPARRSRDARGSRRRRDVAHVRDLRRSGYLRCWSLCQTAAQSNAGLSRRAEVFTAPSRTRQMPSAAEEHQYFSIPSGAG